MVQTGFGCVTMERGPKPRNDVNDFELVCDDGSGRTQRTTGDQEETKMNRSNNFEKKMIEIRACNWWVHKVAKRIRTATM